MASCMSTGLEIIIQGIAWNAIFLQSYQLLETRSNPSVILPSEGDFDNSVTAEEFALAVLHRLPRSDFNRRGDLVKRVRKRTC